MLKVKSIRSINAKLRGKGELDIVPWPNQTQNSKMPWLTLVAIGHEGLSQSRRSWVWFPGGSSNI